MSFGGREAAGPVDLGIDGIGEATRVGQGGFGVVYRARQEAFDRTVAVKVLNVPALDDESRKRFEKECRAMGSVSGHPYIVAVYGSGRTRSDQPYLIMEYLVGGSLAQLIADDGPLPWEEVADAGVKLAGALATAHAAGVLHRDVKPDNVLVSAYAEPQLSDFGVARIQGGTETRTGIITGSLAHAAPEVLKGKPAGEASDVYSLASTLFALASGHAPFARPEDETYHPILTRIMSEDPPDLAALGMPEPVWDVIAAGLAKEPAQRIRSARAFGQALRAAQEEAGVQPTPLVAPGADEPTLPVFNRRGSTAPVERSVGPPASAPSPAGGPPRSGDRTTYRRERPWPAVEPAAAEAAAAVAAAGADDGPDLPVEVPPPAWPADGSSVSRRQPAPPGADATTYRRDRPWPGVETAGGGDEEAPSRGGRRWPAAAALFAGPADGDGDPTPEAPFALRASPAATPSYGTPPPRSSPPPPPSPPPPSYEPGPTPSYGPVRSGSPGRWAVVGVVAVLVVATVAILFVLSQGDGTTETTAPTTTVAGTPATSTPSGPATTSVPGSAGPGVTPPPPVPTAPPGTPPPADTTPESITFVQPPNDEVGRCHVFRGNATLRPGRALAVAVGTRFDTVTSWDGAGNFSRPVTFAESSVGQPLTVRFVVYDQGAPPSSGQQIAATQVTRVDGDGDC